MNDNGTPAWRKMTDAEADALRLDTINARGLDVEQCQAVRAAFNRLMEKTIDALTEVNGRPPTERQVCEAIVKLVALFNRDIVPELRDSAPASTH